MKPPLNQIFVSNNRHPKNKNKNINKNKNKITEITVDEVK